MTVEAIVTAQHDEDGRYVQNESNDPVINNGYHNCGCPASNQLSLLASNAIHLVYYSVDPGNAPNAPEYLPLYSMINR